MPRSVLLLLLAAWLGAAPVRAQVQGPTADRFTHLGIEDGLSQSAVTTILQDREGFLWFGTNDGLNRYDGVGFTVFRHASGDPLSLASSRVMHVLEDRNGTLWVGTQGGLQWFDRARGTFHGVPGGPGQDRSRCGTIVTSLLETRDGALWSGALTGEICRRQRRADAFEPLPRAETADQMSVQALVLEASGDRVWVYSAPDACTVAIGGARCEPVPGPLASLPIVSDARGGVVGVAANAAATSSRFVTWSGSGWRDLVTLSGVRISVGTQVAAHVGGALWVGTENSGVAVMDVATGETAFILPEQSVESGFRDATVHAVYEDREGAVWLGTSSGVSRWDGRADRFELYRAREGGLSSDRANGMHVARDGHVWIGTNDGLNRLDPASGEIEIYRRPQTGQSVHPNAFWRVMEDARGRVLVGARREGLYVVENGQFRRDPVLDAVLQQLVRQPRTAAIRYIGEDRRQRLWLGTADGVAMHDPASGEVAVYRSRTPRLPAHRVNVVHEDVDGGIWLGTDAGVCRLNTASDAFECLGREDGLASEVTWTLAESPVTPEALWVGTIGGGLCRIHRQTLAVGCAALGSGLPSDVIYGVLPDASGALWLTTTAGLVEYAPRSGAVRRFTEADGLQSNEFDLMAFARGSDGFMLVGGRKGVNRFHPDRLRRAAPAPPIRLTALAVLGERRAGLPASGDTLTLRHDETVFSVDFAALDFTDPRNNRYRYRLRGFDEAWRETDGRRPTASYTRVPPGTYTFEVVGSSRDGQFSQEAARLTVLVHPAWWQRADVRLLGFLLLAGSLGWWFRQRLRQTARAQASRIQVQRQLAESRERERYRIARELHDGPVQGLYRLGHQLDRAALRGNETSADAPSVRAAREQVNDVADELRDVLRALRPPVIEHLGVGPAVSSLAREVGRSHPEIEMVDRVDVDGRKWPADVQHAIYRIAQEALANATRHAAPSRIALSLSDALSTVALVVEDDGRGFTVPNSLADLTQAGHFGLVGLVERAEALHGRVRLHSRPGEGTRLTATFPLDAKVDEWPARSGDGAPAYGGPPPYPRSS